MADLTLRDVMTHRAVVPWPNMRQVEQDLLLCRSMDALFKDDFLSSQVSMRGGTLLHKVHLAPASRYSEDIDLVVHGDRPENHIRKAINRVLKDILGEPANSTWEDVKLAVRNAVRPSRILRLIYRVPSVSGGEPLEIVVEANVTERKSHLAIVRFPFQFQFRNEDISSMVNGYDIHEMLGTKMRALFQRKRGRDLFDLYWALTMPNTKVEPEKIIGSFLYYMEQEGTTAGREEFVAILESYLMDHGFLKDMEPLLRTGIQYDPQLAGVYLIENLLSLLPHKTPAIR
jgi:predicted nucleotidyltransferase component of viral defense system